MGIIQRQGIRNSIITYIGIALGALSVLYIQPRFLSKEELGLTRVLLSISTLMATFMPLGMNAAVMRFFPHFRNRDKNHFGFFGFMLILPASGYLILGGLVWLFRENLLAQYSMQSALFREFFYYIFPLSAFLNFIYVLTAYSYSIFRTSVPLLINDVLVRIGFILLVSVYFIKWITLHQFIILFVAIYGLQLAVLIAYLFYEDRPSIRPDWEKIGEVKVSRMVRYGLLMALSGLSAIGLKYLDTVMIAMYQPRQKGLNGFDVAGIYSVAAFVATFVEAPLNALEKIITPKMADGWAKNDRADIQYIYFSSARYLFLAGGLLFVLINVNIDSLFALIPDKDFSLGKNVVLIISTGTLLNMATGANDSILYTSGKYFHLSWLLLGLLLLAYINYVTLIPMFGLEGAAMATALSSTVFNLAKFALIWRFFHLMPFQWHTVKIAVVIALSFLAAIWIPDLGYWFFNGIVRTTAAVAVYGSLTYVFNIVPEFHHFLPWHKSDN
ncbi:MAG: polysaccharide biosynthesis C-terminal domain-containing protein [Chitinophagales bacterium]